jgi:type I restriction enzyme, S subunit
VKAWETQPLGDVCDVKSGGTPSRKRPEYYGGDIPWVKIGDMLQGHITYTEEMITQEGLARSAAKLLPSGTVLLSIFATIGRTAVLEIDAATNQAIAGITPRDSGVLLPDYLRRFLDHAASGLARQGRGIAQANINLEILRSLPVPLPPLREQRLIADVLNRADELQTRRRATFGQLEALKQSIFHDMFGDPRDNPYGWPVNDLRDLSLIAGQYGAGVPSIEFDPRLPRYIRITDVSESGDLTENPVSPARAPSEWERHRLQPGDILFARSGATVGKVYLHRENFDAVFAGYFVRFRPDPERLLPEVLFHFTRTSLYRGWVANKQRAVAQPNINAKQYGDLAIPVPPIALQKEFVNRIVGIGETEKTQKTSSLVMSQLFSSLRDQAFAGAL